MNHVVSVKHPVSSDLLKRPAEPPASTLRAVQEAVPRGLRWCGFAV